MLKKAILFFLSMTLLAGVSNSQFVSTGGPGEESVLVLRVVGNALYAGTRTGGVYVYNGTSWTQINNGIGAQKVNCLASLNNILFAGTDKGLYKSSNNGTEWTLVNYGGNNEVICLEVNNGNLFLGSGGGKVYKSTNNGAGWTIFFNDATHGSVHAMLFNNDYIYFGVQGVYVSTNSGTSWIYETLEPGGYSVNSFCVTGSVIRVGTNYGGKKSTNPLGGWVYDMPWINPVFGYAVSDNFILAAMTGGFFWSSDYGNSWNSPNTNYLAGLPVWSVTRNSQYIFAGTENGVYKRSVSVINGISVINSEIPDKFLLKQNYPNPFNPETKIKFSIPKYSNVKLIIYNILGVLVEELINKDLEPGNYEYQFVGSELSSGIYYYKITAGNFIDTRKMVLVK